MFVAVMALGHDIGGLAPSGTPYLKPRRPYRNVEFWRHGSRMDEVEGRRLAMEAVVASTFVA